MLWILKFRILGPGGKTENVEKITDDLSNVNVGRDAFPFQKLEFYSLGHIIFNL
jgi:hypothetical protein